MKWKKCDVPCTKPTSEMTVASWRSVVAAGVAADTISGSGNASAIVAKQGRIDPAATSTLASWMETILVERDGADRHRRPEPPGEAERPHAPDVEAASARSFDELSADDSRALHRDPRRRHQGVRARQRHLRIRHRALQRRAGARLRRGHAPHHRGDRRLPPSGGRADPRHLRGRRPRDRRASPTSASAASRAASACRSTSSAW